MLNSSHDHFGSHQGKNVKVTMKFEVPIRHSLRHTFYPLTMVQRALRWERQKRCFSRKRQGPMAEKRGYNIFIYLMNFFWGGREDEDKRRCQENGQT